MDLTDDEKAVVKEYRRYKEAAATALLDGHTGDTAHFDKSRFIGRMNHEAGHAEDMILDDLREAAEAAGWSIKQYAAEDEDDS